MTTLQQLQNLDLGFVTTGLLVLAVLAMVVMDAVIGRRDHRALVEGVRDAATPAAAEAHRRGMYRSWIRAGWILGIAVAVAGIALVGPAAMGLRAPDFSTFTPDDSSSSLAGMVVGAVVGVGILAVAMAIASRRSTLPVMFGAKALAPMLPTTTAGRRSWAGLSLMAGVTEEITYRALPLLAITAVLPQANRSTVLVIAAVIFGLAHSYQGIGGVLGTGLAGFAFASLYLATGSLIPGMILHVLIDLRALVVKFPASAATTPQASASASGVPAAA